MDKIGDVPLCLGRNQAGLLGVVSVRKSPDAFMTAIIQTALHKRLAAEARRSSDPTAEKPKEAILDACRVIAEGLGPKGYEFRPSGPSFVRKNGDLTYRLSFTSDRHNATNFRAAVQIGATVSSLSLQRWRKRQPVPPFRHGPKTWGDFAGQVLAPSGNPDTVGFPWNFIQPLQREAIVADLLQAFNDLNEKQFAPIEAKLLDGELPTLRDGVNFINQIELAYAFRGKEEATRVARNIVSDLGKSQSDLKRWIIEYKSNGLPSFWSALPMQQFAAELLALDLHILD